MALRSVAYLALSLGISASASSVSNHLTKEDTTHWEWVAGNSTGALPNKYDTVQIY